MPWRRRYVKNDPRTAAAAPRRPRWVRWPGWNRSWLVCAGYRTAPPGQKRAAANAAVIHVLADQATLDGTTNDPGYLPGHGILPAQSVRDLAATAKLKPTADTGPTGPYR